MEENKEVENRVTRKRQQVEKKKKSVKFKKSDIKIPEFLKLTKQQLLILSFIIIVVAICVCVANYDKLGLVLNKNITDDDVIKVDLITSKNKIYPYQNEVLVCNSEGITTYSKYGKQTWNLELKGAIDDYINTNGKYLQIINHDKSLIYIYKDKYEKARIKVDGTILSGYINNNGYSVIEYTTTGNKTILAVYDNDGDLKYNVKLSSNIIGKYVISSDEKYLAYVELNIKGISVATKVMIVELKTGSVKTVHESETSLAYDINFVGNKLICKLDEEIIIYNLNNDTKKTSNIKDESIVSIDIDDKKYAYSKFENGKYFLGIKIIGGTEKENVHIKEMPKYFIYNNGNVFVCYQKNIEVYNSFKKKIKEYESVMIITEPIVFENGHSTAFLVSNKLVMFSI